MVFSKKGDLLLKIEDVDLVTMEAEARANLPGGITAHPGEGARQAGKA